MAQVSGQGTVWNLPNYWGELFTADMISTPFMNMIGGLSVSRNGIGIPGKQTDNFEFPVTSEYDFPSATQPAITETGSLTAPTAVEAVRTQTKNVVQIYQQAVSVSYEKMSNKGRLSGINTVGGQNNAADELAFQINYNLQIIARNIEYTCLRGAYQIATDAGTANKTRGMLAACAESGSTAVAAGSVYLTKEILDAFFAAMFAAGAMFIQPVIWGNAFQIQKISDIYGYQPMSATVGGVAVDTIITQYGRIAVAKPHRLMPTTELLCADMAVVEPVTQPVEGKGNFFYESLAKTGASENGQIYGHFGLDHGPVFAHGKITGLLDA